MAELILTLLGLGLGVYALVGLAIIILYR